MKMRLADVRENPLFQRWQKEATGVVEANNFEALCLWQLYSKDGEKHVVHTTQVKRLDWKDEGSGVMAQVDEEGTTISLRAARIDGQTIVFYSDESQVVDHRNIDKWLRECFPDARFTNSQNFRNALR